MGARVDNQNLDDPNLQRWPNRDPLGDIGSPLVIGQGNGRQRFLAESYGGPNLYTYAENSPIIIIDPFGLWGFTIDFGGSAGYWVGAAGDIEFVYVSGKGWNLFTAGGGGLVSPGGEGHLYFGPIFNITDPCQYRGNFLTFSGNTPPALPYPGIGGGIFGWPFGKDSPWGFKLGPVYGTPGFSLVWQWYKQWTGVK